MTGKARGPARLRPTPPAQPSLPEGECVYLRVLVKADAAAFVAAAQASLRLHRPWVHPPATPGEFARRMRRKRDDSKWIALLAVRREDDALLGVFNLSDIIRGPLQQSFLGYYAFSPHTGQGYMREGLRLVLKYAFRELKLHRIEANIQPANGPSLALVRACGFIQEGISARYLKIGGRWRDHERWAINADDWRARRRADKEGR
jgi:ribosomal-protein-alanine N-acetyltransferase